MQAGLLTPLFGKKNNLIKLFWDNLLDYIFPKQCFGCSKEGEYLCSACFDKVMFFEKFPCFICNRRQYEVGICPDCSRSSCIDQIVVATGYSDTIAGKLVEALKYDYIESIAVVLAGLLAEQLENKELTGIFATGAVVPIPLHKKRFAERGFNQSELLVEKLSLIYDLKIQKKLLRRSRNTSQQAKLSREERKLNIEDAFVVENNLIIPRTVILVDDVLTTGATFGQSAKVLKNAGVEQVICLAVCHG